MPGKIIRLLRLKSSENIQNIYNWLNYFKKYKIKKNIQIKSYFSDIYNVKKNFIKLAQR